MRREFLALRPKLLPRVSSMKAALPTSFASFVAKVYTPCLPLESWICAVRFSIEKTRVATWVLSLATSSCLLAQNDYDAIPKMHPKPNYKEITMRNSDSESCCEDPCSCDSCSCTSCCCTPCCVPEPKKCIDCECYTPQYYDLQCDWGAFLTVDFLYWYARESNLAYATKVQSIITTTSVPPDQEQIFVPKTYEHFNTDWEPGVRVGLGWNSCCDGWDLYLHWTYFQNNKSASTSVPANYQFGENVFIPGDGECALVNPWLNASLHRFNDLQSFDTITAKWRLRFNNIDLEFGRKYWLSKCFTLRPYTGLRGAWTNTRFNTNSFRQPTNSTLFQKFVNQFTNKYWGVGFVGGIQPNWHFCSNFILFANFEGSLIWGEAEMNEFESQTETENSQLVVTYSNISNDDFFKMQAILDLALGLRWEETWCCDRYRTALDLGWEHHIWINHNMRTKTMNTFENTSVSLLSARGYRTFVETTTDTMFGGFVLRARFDF